MVQDFFHEQYLNFEDSHCGPVPPFFVCPFLQEVAQKILQAPWMMPVDGDFPGDVLIEKDESTQQHEMDS